MSILLGSEILENYQKDKIVIKPFKESQLGPNSYDVHLSSRLATYISQVLDCKINNKVEYFEIPEDGIILKPGVLYLGSTVEAIGSDFFVPMYEGRSSMARLGIQSHISAGFGDIGFKSNWTLEITVVQPVRIYPNVKIGQIYFHRVNEDAKIKLYDGKYKNQKEAQSSLSFKDFEK